MMIYHISSVQLQYWKMEMTPATSGRSMMLCNSVAYANKLFTIPSPSSSSRKSSAVISCHLSFPQRILIPILSTSLSLSLLFSPPPPVFASNDTTTTTSSVLSDSTCREEVQLEEEDGSSRNYGPKINEAIVEEAWEIVNDGFLDSGRRKWSPEAWMQKKGDIIGTSIQTRTKAHDVIKKMLASLGDPYTRFLSPEEFSKMSRYDITGIGINLREIPDDNGNVKLKVLGLILDGPAHAAGVRQGDEVLSVNGMDVKGKSAFEVSSLLQGPSETFVAVQVKHGSCGPIQSINIQRQVVARSPVFYRLEQVDNGKTSVGYIRLKEFNGLARKDLVIAMKRLQDMGASYFILDLRDNLGGLVEAGIEIAKLFLNKGDTVIYSAGRDPLYQSTISADSAPLVSAPLIVLVNNRTASASEIVASALHDNCRAVLVGEKTFGKGLIQSVFELKDGSGVVVTIGKYVTRNHMDINGNGIEPDFRNLPAWSDVAKRLSQCSRPTEG